MKRKWSLVVLMLITALIYGAIPVWAADCVGSELPVISEVQVRGSNGASDEFIEIYNPNACDLNMASMKVQYYSASGGAGASYTFGTTFMLRSGFRFLLTNAASFDGGVTGDGAAPAMADNGQLCILAPNGATVLDAVAWGTVTSYQCGLTAAATSPAQTGVDKSIERSPQNATFNTNSSLIFVVQTTPTPMRCGLSGGSGSGCYPTAVSLRTLSAAPQGALAGLPVVGLALFGGLAALMRRRKA